MKYVSEIARRQNLAISEFQPAKSSEGDGYMTMEVMLNGRGSFASICSFFDELSKVTRLSKVKDVSVTVGDDANANAYPLKATLVIYFGLTDKRQDKTKEAGRG